MDELEKIIDYIDGKDKESCYDIDHRFSDGYRCALRHVRNKVVETIMKRQPQFEPHP